MPYRPRELVIRARDAATLLLASLDRNELVPRFLDMYAAQYRRPSRADRPGLYREQLQTIRRESILAMVTRIESSLPKRLKVSVTVRSAKRPKKGKKGKRAAKTRRKPKVAMELGIPFLELFREEFFIALGQALEWSDEDASEFWRDLDFYQKLNGSAKGQPSRSRREKRLAVTGPFVDRVGLLLDPSLMDQARREAAKFQDELNGAADRVLQRAFARRTY